MTKAQIFNYSVRFLRPFRLLAFLTIFFIAKGVKYRGTLMLCVALKLTYNIEHFPTLPLYPVTTSTEKTHNKDPQIIRTPNS